MKEKFEKLQLEYKIKKDKIRKSGIISIVCFLIIVIILLIIEIIL